MEQGIVRDLYWADTRAVVVSEELARQVGLIGVLDLLDRERQFRLTAVIIVVEGSSQAVLSQGNAYGELAGPALFRQLVSVGHNLSMVPLGNLREHLNELSRPGLEMLLPRMEAQLPEPPTIPNPSRFMGAAAFRNGQMKGWLDGPATRGWNLITGKFSRGTVVVEIPFGGGTLVSVELLRHHSKASISWAGDKPQVAVEVQVMGRVQSQTGDAPLDVPSSTIRKLEESSGRQLKDDMNGAVIAAQSLGTDIFGFGELIYRKHPQRWLALEKQWADEEFPNLEVELQVTVEIQRTGLIVNPVLGGK